MGKSCGENATNSRNKSTPPSLNPKARGEKETKLLGALRASKTLLAARRYWRQLTPTWFMSTASSSKCRSRPITSKFLSKLTSEHTLHSKKKKDARYFVRLHCSLGVREGGTGQHKKKWSWRWICGNTKHRRSQSTCSLWNFFRRLAGFFFLLRSMCFWVLFFFFCFSWFFFRLSGWALLTLKDR